MCAINGCSWSDKALVERMNAVTTHRGPDGTNLWHDEKVTLGHNRLSIIDVRAIANQPMISGDGNLVTVFNGEIYNFKTLREELSSYPYKTESDTEVILAAYRTWGASFVERLNGIFAFAIWDKEKQELFLARDHAGIKPLYYHHQGSKFIFSSEIKGLLEHEIPRKLDEIAFQHYLRLTYVPAPLSLFAGIKKFPAGHYGVFKKDTLTLTSYKKNLLARFAPTKVPTAEDLRATVQGAVERQLISDRPLGIYLSGGIDSSVVLDSAKEAREKVDTFSVGFELEEDEEADKFNQDFLLAQKTALHYGATHHEVMLSTKDALTLLEKAVIHMDEPVANPTSLAMLHLSQFVKPTATVVLTGDGGDELFGGYERYRLSLWADRYQKVPQNIRNVFNFHPRLRKLNTPPGAERIALFMFQKDALLKEVVEEKWITNTTADFFQKNFFNSVLDPFTPQFMEADRETWLIDESLLRADKMAAASGVEARVPFLDPAVIALADSIPFERKVHSFDTKVILKEAFRERLPAYLFTQPKRGWFSPAAKWLRRPEFIKAVDRILSPEYYPPTKDLFKWPAIRAMVKAHREKKVYNLTLIWTLLTFQIWAKSFSITRT